MSFGENQKNLKVEVKGTTMTITIDLNQDHGPSSSGKTHLVSTSDGLMYVEVFGQKWSLNCGLWKPATRNGGK